MPALYGGAARGDVIAITGVCTPLAIGGWPLAATIFRKGTALAVPIRPVGEIARDRALSLPKGEGAREAAEQRLYGLLFRFLSRFLPQNSQTVPSLGSAYPS